MLNNIAINIYRIYDSGIVLRVVVDGVVVVVVVVAGGRPRVVAVDMDGKVGMRAVVRQRSSSW